MTVTLPVQLSEAVTDPVLPIGTWLAHITVTGAGQEMEGGTISCTAIVPLQVAVLPQSSVAVQVRVTLYAPAHEPGVVASTNVISTVASHASVAVGVINTGITEQSTGDVCATHKIVGGVIS